MAAPLSLPIVDFSSPDRASTAKSIRQACLEYGFFYIINHGMEDKFEKVFGESKKFFSLPLVEKMKVIWNKDHRGYTPLYAEIHDTSSKYKGDLKESFFIGPTVVNKSQICLNQWPSEEVLPSWKAMMDDYYGNVLAVGKSLMSLIAMALDLDDNFFEKIGALHSPMAFVRLLHYPGELTDADIGNYGASAHSDYGMITLLATNGVPGLQACIVETSIFGFWLILHHCIFVILQICREKNRQPNIWEDVPHVNGAFIVNVGDMLERWTNCLFRSTLHRVVAIGQERYSIAFFLDPNSDCLVKCLESCCSDKSPPRFPPIRSGDYLEERLRIIYSK